MTRSPRWTCSTIDLEDALREVLPLLEGAFSLVAPRRHPPRGSARPHRPAPVVPGPPGPGRSARGVGARRRSPRPSTSSGPTFVRELEPGEMVDRRRQGRALAAALRRAERIDPHLCIFEFVYFARPDTPPLRPRGPRRAGGAWASCSPPRRPSTPTSSWACPSRGCPPPRATRCASGIPHGQALVKNRYIGRTFITPGQARARRRRASQAQPAAREHRRQAHHRRRRLDRARHHTARRGADAARGRAPSRCTCASRRRRWRGRASSASTSPTATELVGGPPERPRDRGIPERRLPRLPVAREPGGRHRHPRRRLLHGLPDGLVPRGGAGAHLGRGPAEPSPAPSDVEPERARGPPTHPPVSTSMPGSAPWRASATTWHRRPRPRCSAASAASGARSPSTLPGYRQPVLVSSTDGVGTKAAVAAAARRATTPWVSTSWRCASDDIVCVGAEPLFLLDYITTSKLDPDQMEQLVAGVADGCRQAGCALLGGEMAEHPGSLPSGDFDLAGFVVGVVDRARMLGPDRVARRGRARGAARPPDCGPTATPWPATSCSSGPASPSTSRPGAVRRTRSPMSCCARR